MDFYSFLFYFSRWQHYFRFSCFLGILLLLKVLFLLKNILNFIKTSIKIIWNSIILNYCSVWFTSIIILYLCHYRHIHPHNIVDQVSQFLKIIHFFHRNFDHQDLHSFHHYSSFLGAQFPQHHQVSLNSFFKAFNIFL